MRVVYSDGLRWSRAFRVIALLLGIAAVAIESLYEGSDGAEGLYIRRTFAMNLGHFLLFGMVAVAAALAFDLRLPNVRASALIVLGIGVLGWLDEWHQTTQPFRDASVWDIVSDVLGAIFALMIAGWSCRPGGLRAAALPILLLFVVTMTWNIVPTFAPNIPPPTP